MITALILAAGRGERLRPLTDRMPKPLIQVARKPLIAWHLDQLELLKEVGCVVINHAWLGDVLEQKIQSYWQGHSLPITFSAEHQLGLETGGGILKALPLLSDPFIVINGDIFTEFDFSQLVQWAKQLKPEVLGRLVFVPNPSYHPDGDFALVDGHVSLEQHVPKYTFSGISVMRHALFEGYSLDETAPLKAREVLLPAICQKRLEGVITNAFWTDVGTPERLALLRARLGDATPIDQP